MSKINIQGTIDNIKSRTNVYTPLIEAIVNSIDAIEANHNPFGEILIIVKRENSLQFEGWLPAIKSIEIQDNGIGFTQDHRDSFDTFYSPTKKDIGGKGFGRFMFLKYFDEVKIESNYLEVDKKYYLRKFQFGKKDEIIINENVLPSNNSTNLTTVFLTNLLQDKYLDKELETIARKLLENLLIFFVSDNFVCPKIVIKEVDNSKQIVLNDYLRSDNEIKLLKTRKFELSNALTNRKETFTAKVFKIYFSRTESKVILTANNREVTESSLHFYVPEFEDDFYDEIDNGKKIVRKNYVVKTYVIGKYLDNNVSVERETFDFPKEKSNSLYEYSQIEIEKQASTITKEVFATDVKIRAERKETRINTYVSSKAPWHKIYINNVDLSAFPYNATDEKIEFELQKYKFTQEQENIRDVQFLLQSTELNEFEERLEAIVSRVTEIGKSDLVHYVSNRKVVLQIFEELRKRTDEGRGNLEKEIHSLIFPMNRDSYDTPYEEHNLWLLDERLVFSEYIASDRKISKRKDALGEPDLLVFDVKQSFRSGDNEFSNPLTIFEFKRPKRIEYKQEDDPVVQVGHYLDKIRAGKYEMPKGVEPIRVNESTPVYTYIICDLVDKIKEFARQHQLTISPDQEGYFGYHNGFKMYVEIISFKKMMKDATLRNKIFFRKLQIE